MMRISIFAMICFVLPLMASATELRPFDVKSIGAVRAAHAGKPFILAFWSITCDPCRKEMKLWGPLQRKYPDLPIVLVATDAPADHAAVSAFLARHDLPGIETWAFADDFSERIRFAVDRKWRGELPRTYFFDSVHRAEGRSGAIDERAIEDWLKRQAVAAPVNSKTSLE